MEVIPRHQCLIYEGPPSRRLPALAAAMREKLQQNYRCLYLNTEPMVAGMRSSLAAAGVNVAHEIGRSSLVLSSDPSHLSDGRFDIERLLQSLEDSIDQALSDGYVGLWATGDMTWEFGPERDFSKLLEYEWGLEEIFRTRAEISGICQYHADTLPHEAVRKGLLAHPSVFIGETMTLINPHYVSRESFTGQTEQDPELAATVSRLSQLESDI